MAAVERDRNAAVRERNLLSALAGRGRVRDIKGRCASERGVANWRHGIGPDRDLPGPELLDGLRKIALLRQAANQLDYLRARPGAGVEDQYWSGNPIGDPRQCS